MQQRITSEAVQDVFDVAINISNTSYVDARNWILQWQGDLDVRSLLTSMLGTSALWDGSRDNEAGLIKKKFDPFFLTFICSVKHLNAFCHQCYLFTVEVKKAVQGLVIQSDLEKLASEMKDGIDDLASQRINISSVRVFGMVVIGMRGDIYSMALEANGLYVMRSYTAVFAPRSHKGLGGLPLTINVFLNLKADIEESIQLCSRPLLPAIAPQICKSFGTPVKYHIK
ncbi:hypothetical protein BGZ54_001593 [Gamsiella multidivaricata]|nr:hypothetical protein BGZ54_001593 [Gamsiella multidivaricata]